MATPLRLNLPALPDNQLYQLIHQGKIRRHPTNPESSYQLQLYFISKSSQDEFQKAISQPIATWINVFDTHDCVRGSLWTDKGEPVSTGQRIYDSVAGHSHALLDKLRTFHLGDVPMHAVPLGTVWPALPAFQASFLATEPNTWVLTWQQGTEIFILPCFELLRVFAYAVGSELPAWFYSHTPLSSVCYSIEDPTSANELTGHIALRNEKFAIAQRCILGELCFNADYRLMLEKAHSLLSEEVGKQAAGSYPRVDFYMGHAVKLQANGFEFYAAGRSYFFVCGLWPLDNPFSFQTLQVDLLTDHRQGKPPETDTSSDQDHSAGGSRIKPDLRARPPLDSTQRGSSRYSDSSLTPLTNSWSSWPTVTTTPKRTPTPHQRTTTRLFTAQPDALSQTSGGQDERVALLTDVFNSTDEQQVGGYFTDFLLYFQANQEYTITPLQLHNQNCMPGIAISKLSPVDKRGIAAVQLTYAKGFFYFFELLAGGRAAFLHARSLRALSVEEIARLFQEFIAAGLDWVSLKKSQSRDEAQFSERLVNELVIYPRNHEPNGGSATAKRCERVMRKQLSF